MRSPEAYVISNFYSNIWLFFGKLLEARSGLYRRHILQENTRLKALGEIYTIYTCVFGEKITEIENKIMNMCIKYNTEETK